MGSQFDLTIYYKKMNKKNLLMLSKNQLATITIDLSNTVKSLLKTGSSFGAQLDDQNIIQPPSEFRDKPKPFPKSKFAIFGEPKMRQKMVASKPFLLPKFVKFNTEVKPVPLEKAIDVFFRTYDINVLNKKEPLVQLTDSAPLVEV